jgi:ankyrin repeat protein
VSLLVDKLVQAKEAESTLTTELLCPALYDAVRRGNHELVCLFLKQARLLDAERSTSSLLYEVIQLDHEDISLELLDWGITTESRDSAGYTVLMRAFMRGLTRIVEALLPRADVNIAEKTALQETAMTLAVTNNRAKVVRSLLTAGATPYDLMHYRDEPQRPRHESPYRTAFL